MSTITRLKGGSHFLEALNAVHDPEDGDAWFRVTGSLSDCGIVLMGVKKPFKVRGVANIMSCDAIAKDGEFTVTAIVCASSSGLPQLVAGTLVGGQVIEGWITPIGSPRLTETPEPARGLASEPPEPAPESTNEPLDVPQKPVRITKSPTEPKPEPTAPPRRRSEPTPEPLKTARERNEGFGGDAQRAPAASNDDAAAEPTEPAANPWARVAAVSSQVAKKASGRPTPKAEPVRTRSAAPELSLDESVDDSMDDELEVEPEDLKRGDVLLHPALDRCRVLRVEGDNAVVVLLPNGRKRKLILRIFTLHPSDRDGVYHMRKR